MVVAILASTFLVQLILFLKGLKQKILRLPVIFALAVVIFVLSSTLYYFTSPVRFNLFGLEKYITDISFWKTVENYLNALNAFMLGALAVRFLRINITRPTIKKSEPKIAKITSYFLKRFIDKLPFWPLIVGFLLIFILYMLFYASTSWSIIGFWLRNRFKPDGSISAQQALLFLNVTYFTYAGSFFCIKKPKFMHLLTSFFSIILLALELSTGSRKFIVYLAILLFIPVLLVKFSRKDWIIRLGLLVVSTFYIIPLRNLPSHGLLPYSGLGWLLGLTPSPLAQVLKDAYFVYYYNLILGFFLTSYVTNAGVANLHTFSISINPLTSNFVGWYQIAPSLRVSLHAPFNLFGEIFALGVGYIWLFFTVLGGYFAVIDRWIYIKRMEKDQLAFIPMVLLVFFIILAYEYNLRSGMRMLYYTLGFIIVYTLLQKMGKVLLRKRSRA